MERTETVSEQAQVIEQTNVCTKRSLGKTDIDEETISNISRLNTKIEGLQIKIQQIMTARDKRNKESRSQEKTVKDNEEQLNSLSKSNESMETSHSMLKEHLKGHHTHIMALNSGFQRLTDEVASVKQENKSMLKIVQKILQKLNTHDTYFSVLIKTLRQHRQLSSKQTIEMQNEISQIKGLISNNTSVQIQGLQKQVSQTQGLFSSTNASIEDIKVQIKALVTSSEKMMALLNSLVQMSQKSVQAELQYNEFKQFVCLKLEEIQKRVHFLQLREKDTNAEKSSRKKPSDSQLPCI